MALYVSLLPLIILIPALFIFSVFMIFFSAAFSFLMYNKSAVKFENEYLFIKGLFSKKKIYWKDIKTVKIYKDLKRLRIYTSWRRIPLLLGPKRFEEIYFINTPYVPDSELSLKEFLKKIWEVFFKNKYIFIGLLNPIRYSLKRRKEIRNKIFKTYKVISFNNLTIGLDFPKPPKEEFQKLVDNIKKYTPHAEYKFIKNYKKDKDMRDGLYLLIGIILYICFGVLILYFSGAI